MSRAARPRRPHPLLVTWRQGRCLPYGTGIAFWALGEIVKAQAGILESDPRRSRSRSSTMSCRTATNGRGSASDSSRCSGSRPDRSAGRESSSPPGGGSSSSSPTQRPTVLVSRTCTGPTRRCWRSSRSSRCTRPAVPLLVIGTTRPELFERRPGFPGSTERAVRIDARAAAARRGHETSLRDLLEACVDRARGSASRSSSARRQPAVRRGVHPAAPRP